MRELTLNDVQNGFLPLLNELSEVGELDVEGAKRVLFRISRNPYHRILVALDEADQVIGSTTLFVEPKFIHNGGTVGHIEDVVVRSDKRGLDIGRMLVESAVELARKVGCYKCILDCDERVAGFYERVGFSRHGLEMRIDLHEVGKK